VHNLEIYNNVIYGMNPNIGSHRLMVSISGNYQNLRIHNNIIHGTVGRDLFPVHGAYLGSGLSGVASGDHNLYCQVDPQQYILYVNSQGYRMSQWETYRNATDWDLNSPMPRDAVFADVDNDDFRPRGGSAVIDAGSDVGLPYEGSAPDIGAIEVTPSGDMDQDGIGDEYEAQHFVDLTTADQDSDHYRSGFGPGR
jgi:hypothetical protein